MRIWVRGIRGIAAIMTTVMTLGCGDDLPDITDIRGTRIIGARFSVQGEPSRATAKPGERVDVAFQMVSGDPHRDNTQVRSMFMDCTFPERYTGLPLCQEFFDIAASLGPNPEPVDLTEYEPIKCIEDNEFTVEGVSGTCVLGDPKVTLNVFEGSSQMKLVRGVICERGTPFFDVRLPEFFGCVPPRSGGGVEMLVHGSVPVQVEESGRNDNPDFDDMQVLLNGRPWEAVDLADLPEAGAPCEDGVTASGLLAVDPYDHDLWFEAAAGLRQEADGVPEVLEFSVYADGGEVGRRFAIFESEDVGDEDGLLRESVPWVAPKREDVPEGGRMVTFYLTVIDRRGGFDLAVRHACVIAPESTTAN